MSRKPRFQTKADMRAIVTEKMKITDGCSYLFEELSCSCDFASVFLEVCNRLLVAFNILSTVCKRGIEVKALVNLSIYYQQSVKEQLKSK